MLKRILFFAGAATIGLFLNETSAQNIPFRKYCATDSMTQAALQQYPDYAKKRKEFEQYVLSLNGSKKQAKIAAADSNYTIPIVIHVMHTYGADNIADAQVLDAVRIINEDFSKLNADTNQVIPEYQSRNANVRIRFALAQKDPNGNCTNGITRTYTTLTNNADNNVKSLIRWDPTKYLNIWVVGAISFGAGGYSYLPCGVPQDIEGIVVLATQFGSIGRSNGGNFSARTLTHEIGHYMGLPHVWGGSNSPGNASNCGIDDGINDTPNTIGSTNFSCNLSANSCTAPDINDVTQGQPFPDNVQNYMDYSSCARMFTKGQKAVMVGSLLNQWCRNNLSDSLNLVATGTTKGYTALCAPIADFRYSAPRICPGNTVTFTDQSYNAFGTKTYQWSFQGGTPATSTDPNPVITYNTPGTYNVSLTTSNSASPSGHTVTRSNLVEVKAAVGAETAPFAYGFEDTSFPNHPSDPAKSFDIEKATSVGWERTMAGAATGNASARIRNANMPAGSVNSLITPAIDMSNLTSPMLRFKIAYAQKNANSNEMLKVYMSNNCGQTWTLRTARAGVSLSTTNGNYITGTFTPSASQWRQEAVSINSAFIGPNTLIKFEATSQLGNTLYLDDIEISGITGTAEDMLTTNALTIFPNPAQGNATIRVNVAGKGNVKVAVFTLTGQQIGEVEFSKNQSGNQELTLSEITGKSALRAGVYMIRLEADGYSTQQKAVIF